ncbi:inactive tyrosine-protein kinase PEAK1-like [Centroberyx affinis]|uniref:inactive tyrosine-protein kinase PEAK1-like n=1 Tax=Centroberyx affinis TaxID=166261 RepID=UPI003A5C30C0
MEPGPASRAEAQPPALPVKQRRSQLSRGSSLESDCIMLSPFGQQHQSYPFNDVFPEATDCHAAGCPIHQRYDDSHHQERFFSDGTPPPVPKKRLARALSLPADNMPPPSPLLPMSPLSPLYLRHHPQNFDNPLYMLAPIPDTHSHEEREEVKPVKKSPVPVLSLSQLSFDTPDEHLQYLFSSFDDQGVVSQGIQHRHLLFLRSMAQSVEAEVLLQGEASVPYQPQDFLLCGGQKPKQIGDALYYSVHSPKFPRRVLGLRVHRWTDPAPSAHTSHQLSHVNVQDVIAHFPPDSILKNESNTLQTRDPMVASSPLQSDCTTAKPPCGGNTESTENQSDSNINSSTVLSLLQKGCSVTVERDLPQATLKDFVQDSRSLQSSEPSLYERQVCVLLLQIVMGLQHLHNNSAAGVELRPQDVFLVWPRRKKGEKTEGEAVTDREQEAERVQMLWRAWGAPRVVLTHHPPCVSGPQPLTSQIGALLQHCLHPQESLSSLTRGSAAALSESPYKMGLLYLASWLQTESSGLQMADVVAFLQALLWGPHVPLVQLNCNGSTTTTVHNWLSIKRALLVMKLAERGLIQDQSVLDWEDCLCLQYLSFTDSETVTRATNRLGLNVG